MILESFINLRMINFKIFKLEQIKIPSFLKSVITLSIGTFLSQLLGFLFLPILSRIYSPQEFGLFYTFTGITQILCLFSTLKYEKSIILPEKKNDSNSLIILTVFIILFFATTLFFTILLYKLLDFRTGEISNLIFYVPITIICFSIYSVIIQLFQRDEKFKIISLLGLIQSLFIFGLSAFFYFINIKNGLIIGYILGCSFSILFILITQYDKFKQVFSDINLEIIKINFLKYIDFPKYYLLYDLLSSGLTFVLPIIISTFYSKVECGLFTMAYRILMVPVIVISIAVSNVFLVKAKKEYSKSLRFNILFRTTLNKLVLISLFIYIPIFFFGGTIIALLLGSKWENIDLYVKVISIILFFEFIVYVFRSNTYIIVQKQKTGMVIQFFSTLFCICCLIFLSKYGIKISLIIYTTISISFACLNLLISYRFSKGV